MLLVLMNRIIARKRERIGLVINDLPTVESKAPSQFSLSSKCTVRSNTPMRVVQPGAVSRSTTAPEPPDASGHVSATRKHHSGTNHERGQGAKLR